MNCGIATCLNRAIGTAPLSAGLDCVLVGRYRKDLLTRRSGAISTAGRER
ncbi:MAG: hypothetical protein NTZ78_02445 [Candidatus Aureabacteria bacterium]|nr:hypothetical protein [Candidatus Auribacterota bacterium]